ncbi:MAG: hypothetical protein HPY79_12250 [Bacteroidales bacterium]|jgi:DNA-binding Xre family transcriptional regulator|nr:hypothetical protein [Bacteroidales bacterium]
MCRKYAILDILQQLPYERYVWLKKNLHNEINVSYSTLRRWLYIKDKEKAEIPLAKLKLIAKKLDVDINQLIK